MREVFPIHSFFNILQDMQWASGKVQLAVTQRSHKKSASINDTVIKENEAAYLAEYIPGICFLPMT
jgi:hypothetical protein